MKTNENIGDSIVTSIKTCLENTGLDILSMSKSKGCYVIRSEVDLGYLKIQIKVIYGVEDKMVTVELEFPDRLPTKRFGEIYDIINRINAVLMDIGHFSFYPKTGKLFLRTGNDVADGSLNSRQFEESICRFIGQGEIGYHLISQVAFDNILTDEAWRDFIYQAQTSISNEIPTLH